MNHACELCGAEKANKFSAFELESWENFNSTKLAKKDSYYLCYACFDKITEDPLHTPEIQERLKENRNNLHKLMEEGKVCPNCKSFIVEEPHTCP
jgi:hypothetical protein